MGTRWLPWLPAAGGAPWGHCGPCVQGCPCGAVLKLGAMGRSLVRCGDQRGHLRAMPGAHPSRVLAP